MDLRIQTIPEKLRSVAARQLRDALGAEFDVLHEGIGQVHEHVHCEYDPKG